MTPYTLFVYLNYGTFWLNAWTWIVITKQASQGALMRILLLLLTGGLKGKVKVLGPHYVGAVYS